MSAAAKLFLWSRRNNALAAAPPTSSDSYSKNEDSVSVPTTQDRSPSPGCKAEISSEPKCSASTMKHITTELRTTLEQARCAAPNLCPLIGPQQNTRTSQTIGGDNCRMSPWSMSTPIPKRALSRSGVEAIPKRVKFSQLGSSGLDEGTPADFKTGAIHAQVSNLSSVPRKPQLPNTFRDFQVRYPSVATPVRAPRRKLKIPLTWNHETERRKTAMNVILDSREPNLAQSLQQPRIIPPYLGTSRQFLTACVYLDSLLRKNHTSLHRSLWDDFVRFFTSVWSPMFESWLRTQEEQLALDFEDPFLANLRLDNKSELMEPALSMYCANVHTPVYSGGILYPESLLAALNQDEGLTMAAKAMLAAREPNLAKEGRSSRAVGSWHTKLT